MNRAFHRIFKWTVFLCAILFLFAWNAFAQAPAEKAQEKPAAKVAEKTEEPPNAAQIELLETKYRFETNGDSRKEVHAVVKINSELGVRQFARLNFDYNRSFQSVEIPLVRITHANGGTSDILPSAVTDAPNPIVEKFPAYHDVRVKSVRILGLQPGDSLEYRIITTTSHNPLVPGFWLDHLFDRNGVVSTEKFELDLPGSSQLQIRINPAVPPIAVDKTGEGDTARSLYRWAIFGGAKSLPPPKDSGGPESSEPDVAFSTTAWEPLSIHLDGSLTPGARLLESLDTYEESTKELLRRYDKQDDEIISKSAQLTSGSHTTREKAKSLYSFVSQKITTVDLPLGATGFRLRLPKEVLGSGYATQEDKFVLLAALSSATNLGAEAGLTGYCDKASIARPTVFRNLLVRLGDKQGWTSWLDPSLEVAPFESIPANSGNCIFILQRGFFAMNSTGHEWEGLKARNGQHSAQHVFINASLGVDGTLHSKVHYVLRGQNELLLRVTFHQTPEEKQKEIAQYLALSDGFRGKVTSVKTSDPYETDKPFEVEYELTQEKFVDWSKKPVLIPALLPLPGLPELPKKSAGDSKIELGPPLDIELSGTLRLPPGVTAQAPVGTSAKRDYATFTSEYSAKENLVHFSRHLNFLLPEIPATRAVDLGAFLHAVQSDQSQLFVLDKPDSVPPAKSK